MARVQEVDFDFQALHQMDNGRIAALLRRHMSSASADCVNRPTDKGKRKVIVEFNFVPIPDPYDPGEVERVDCEIECRSKTPVYRSRVIKMRPHKSGFITNLDFPDSLEQQPLPFKEGDEEQ